MPKATPRGVAPAHGVLQRPGAKPALRLVELPPWHGWRYTSEAARARRFLESKLVVPTGYGAGRPLRLARFQRRLIDLLYDSLALFVSIAAANGKTTLLAALALERICRGDDYVEVDVVATKEEQAAILVETAKRMVECAPELVPLVSWHAHEGVLEYRPTGSRLAAHPAKLAALQGLNFSLAIVDEVGFATDDVVESLLARLAKRPDAHLIGIGTPGFEANVLQRMRAAHLDGELPPGVQYLSWSAPPGCDLADREAWRQANPALEAGFMSEDALAVQAAMLPERAFRTYHLGQYVDASASWLPDGAWEALPLATRPPRDTDVVLAVEGTHRRTLSLCGATLSGEVFHLWSAEAATDAEARAVIDRAAEQWHVLELVHPRRIRPGLFGELGGMMPCTPWSSSPLEESMSAGELYRAVTEGRLAHDHDPVLAEHIAALEVRWSVDGSLRLSRPDTATADAALAARAAWWRAGQLAGEVSTGEAPRVY